MWNTSYYSELPHEGETELWEILNLTADAHPMHPHLVAFQVLNRQPLDVKGYTAAYNAAFAGERLPIDGCGPAAGLQHPAALRRRRGIQLRRWWIRHGPSQLLRARRQPRSGRYPLSAGPPGSADAAGDRLEGHRPGASEHGDAHPRALRQARPGRQHLPTDSAGYDFSPNHGHGYVWHCHIVDHEDNEMMRPFSVNANPNSTYSLRAGGRLLAAPTDLNPKGRAARAALPFFGGCTEGPILG